MLESMAKLRNRLFWCVVAFPVEIQSKISVLIHGVCGDIIPSIIIDETADVDPAYHNPVSAPHILVKARQCRIVDCLHFFTVHSSPFSMVERFREREGHYPSRILADKIYRNRENLSYCKERGIRLSGPALGRPRKGEIRDKAQDYLDECERVEVERRFSLAKQKCGMGLVAAKLQETAAHVIAMSVLVLNLRKIQRALLLLFAALLAVWMPQRKLAIVQ